MKADYILTDRVVEITHVMVIKRPDGAVFQLAGSKDDLDMLVDVMRKVPKKHRGEGWVHEIDGDQVYVNSDDEEILRVPGGQWVTVPDVRPMYAG
jgi:hypothetical protein